MTDNFEIIYEGQLGYYRQIKISSLTQSCAQFMAVQRDIYRMNFQLLGDLVCPMVGNLALRGYVLPGGKTYATIGCRLDQRRLIYRGLDFDTTFADGAFLTTSTASEPQSYPEKHIYKNSYKSLNTVDLYNMHCKEVLKLKLQHGEAQKMPTDLKSLAIFIDAALAKELLP